MKYFKETKTGVIYAYSTEDLSQVARITRDSPKIFHEISEKLKGAEELKGAELEEHLNPTPTNCHLVERGRAERDAALRIFDTFVSNPLRYAELSAEQKEEAQSYRQALLSVPQQESFPKSYVMPEAPSWLQ